MIEFNHVNVCLFHLVASLLGCLHQLKSDNMKLEKKLSNLQSRKDRLLGLNARLAASFSDSPDDTPDDTKNSKVPLSAMLSKLNELTPDSEKAGGDCDNEESPRNKKSKMEVESPDRSFPDIDLAVPSPDLAMLAATSAKFDNRMSRENNRISPSKNKNQVLDEKAPIHPLSSVSGAQTTLLQPNASLGQSTSLLNGILHSGRLHLQEHFGNEVCLMSLRNFNSILFVTCVLDQIYSFNRTEFASWQNFQFLVQQSQKVV